MRLSAFVELTVADQELLEHALTRQIRRLDARRDVIGEGENPRAVNVLLDGWAMRYKQLADGRRQILSFLIPGDLCDANVFILKEMDHSLGSITPITYAEIPQPDFEEIMEKSPRIAKALWWSELVNLSIQREWTTNIGQRSAYERLAHLFCEVFARLSVAGLVTDRSFHFPLTQTDIADATGMTPVHVNRTLQLLRREGLLDIHNRSVALPDPARLMEVALFNPNYLHLGHRR